MSQSSKLLQPKPISIFLFKSSNTDELRRSFGTFLGNRQGYKLCWKCKHRLRCSSLFCSDSMKNGKACGVIQPVHERTAFTELFFPDKGKLPVSAQFKVEYSTLRENYLNLQKKVHPDYWATKSPELGEIAKDQSSFVNRGFYTLKDPVRRAKYLLSLNGFESREAEVQSEEFLERIFDLNVRIRTGPEETCRGARAEAREMRDDLLEKLEMHFAREDLSAASKCTGMLQYVERVLQVQEGDDHD